MANTVSNREIVKLVDQPTTSVVVALGPTQFGYLGTLIKLFERYRIVHAELEWHPAVGATTDGRVAICFDLDPSAKPLSYTNVSTRQYSTTTPLWGKASVLLPTGHAKEKMWYKATEDQFLACVSPSAGTSAKPSVGELWISYTVQFEAPALNSSTGST